MHEKRKFARIPLARKVKVSFKGKFNFINNLADISMGGMFLKTSVVLPVGETFSFEFDIEEGLPKITGKGKVVRFTSDDKGNQNGMGIEFTSIDSTGKALLSKIIEEYQSMNKEKESDIP